MADTFRKLKSGERLNMPEALYSILVDMARDYRAGKFGRGAGGGASDVFRQTGIVKVRNGSGVDVPRFGILGLDVPLTDPADNLGEFTKGVVLNGVTPTDSHRGGFAVALEALAKGPSGSPTKGAAGVACVSGICVAKVDFADAGLLWADVKSGSVNELKGFGDGDGKVLWKESGTGVKWAILCLGAGTKGTFPVRVTKDAGAAGTATTTATWTYTVKALNNTTVLGTAVAVSHPREKGLLNFGTTYGEAFYDGSTLILWRAGEYVDTGEGCAP